MGRRAPEEKRFVPEEEIFPRFLKVNDTVAGLAYFEFTEVEDGGTIVKATYSPLIKTRIARFKAHSPLKIPGGPIGYSCPSCGKVVLNRFILCPYCGQKLISQGSNESK